MNIHRDTSINKRSIYLKKQQHGPDKEQYQGRPDEDKIRRIQEHELEVPPAVTPRVEMRGPVAFVPVERDGNLLHPEMHDPCLDDHLGGEFHTARLELQSFEGRLGQSAHAAVTITDPRPEEQVQDEREYRCPKLPMEEWHRTLLDSTLETGPDDELVTFPEILHEIIYLIEII